MSVLLWGLVEAENCKKSFDIVTFHSWSLLNDGSEWCFVCHKFFFQLCKHHNTVVILMQGNKQIEKAPLLEDPVVVKKFSTFALCLHWSQFVSS